MQNHKTQTSKKKCADEEIEYYYGLRLMMVWDARPSPGCVFLIHIVKSINWPNELQRITSTYIIGYLVCQDLFVNNLPRTNQTELTAVLRPSWWVFRRRGVECWYSRQGRETIHAQLRCCAAAATITLCSVNMTVVMLSAVLLLFLIVVSITLRFVICTYSLFS